MLNKQAGIGLLEIIIALFILALAVLGFSAMQMRAVKATDETLYRSDALVAVRNISEDLRLLPTADQRRKYQDAINRKTPASKNCNSNACTADEQLIFNAAESLALANAYGIEIAAKTCPGLHANTSLNKMCLIAAWGDTTATMNGNISTTTKDCTDIAGVYRPGATCFVVETY